MRTIASTWMRGGTSKCWVFEHEELAVPGWSRDELLLRLFGSPDPRQLDGIGGGTSTTSKAAIVSRPANATVDVDYTFAQVAVDEARVEWGSNCGNCATAVGLFAVRRGWVPVTGELTTVRVHNTNSSQLILLQVPTPGGVLSEAGHARRSGTRMRVWFVDPAGGRSGALFPSGHSVDVLDGPEGPIEVTIVDAGAPVVMVEARAFGLTGQESPAQLDERVALLAHLEQVRRLAAVRAGMVDTVENAQRAVPKLALVAPPDPDQHGDLVVRMLSMGRTHPAIAITGSVALTMAAENPQTIAGRTRASAGSSSVLTLLTPAGMVRTWSKRLGQRPAVAVLRSARWLGEAALAIPEPHRMTDIDKDRTSVEEPW